MSSDYEDTSRDSALSSDDPAHSEVESLEDDFISGELTKKFRIQKKDMKLMGAKL